MTPLRCLSPKVIFHRRSSTYHNTLVDHKFVRTVNIPNFSLLPIIEKFVTDKFLTDAGIPPIIIQIVKNCDHKANTKNGLVHHQRSVHDRVRYQSRESEKKLSSKSGLVRHQRTVHEGIKYPCERFEQKFSAKSELLQHRRSIHKGVNHQCRECNNQFSPQSLSQFFSNSLPDSPV